MDNQNQAPQEQPTEQSFADYVTSDAFQQAYTGQAGQQQQPFVDNAYQQPWNGENSYTYAQQQAYNQGYQQAYNQTYTQQTYRGYVSTKDHVAAGLLAIFLGSLGIHKFYLGYNTAGFIMLGVTIIGSLFTFGLAAGVMGVIAFIEGVIYLTKNQTAFDAEYVYGHKEWF